MGFTEVMIRIATPCHLCHPAKARASAGTIERGLPVVADRRRVTALKWLLHLLLVRPAGSGSVFWRILPSGTGEVLVPRAVLKVRANQLRPALSANYGLIMSLYRRLNNAQSEVIVRFRDSNGQPKDVGEVKTDLSTNLPAHGHAFHKRRKARRIQQGFIERSSNLRRRAIVS
jgi:hypothetical protein